MKKSILSVALTLLMVSSAYADLYTYRFTFTGEDLMGHTLYNGDDGVVAADIGAYDGASAYGYSANTGRVNSYWTSQHSDFEAAITDTSVRLLDFNLWGFDNPQPNQGTNWGDAYRPVNWGQDNVGGNDPAGWTSTASVYPWGDPPGDSVTDILRGWEASSFADGFNWNDTDLADHVFEFDVTLDTDQVTYPGITWPDGATPSPNYADENGAQITFWFGGIMEDENGEWGYENYWQTNMVLDGVQVAPVVPAPGAALLGVMGLSIVGWIRRRLS